ncbi:hypothetical protein DERP_008245 [Dermatophagoides pteronyssinus]|uniref:Uncharacterized protein n=1 Tax=Dermatophagoides pteronyssinus TaxID=6956 RepID=A0ABQ8J608_DERPT|nr:hypothetical protein DERP_008245 [Dermatophagoides pteronyssinus]
MRKKAHIKIILIDYVIKTFFIINDYRRKYIHAMIVNKMNINIPWKQIMDNESQQFIHDH